MPRSLLHRDHWISPQDQRESCQDCQNPHFVQKLNPGNAWNHAKTLILSSDINLGMPRVMPRPSFTAVVGSQHQDYLKSCQDCHSPWPLDLSRLSLTLVAGSVLSDHQKPPQDLLSLGSSSVITFSLGELKTYTQNFSERNMVGSGGFSQVYKGLITGRAEGDLNGKEVAIKVSFSMAEVTHLPKFSHPKIIQLIGKCETTKRFILVYPLMRRGNVQENLAAQCKSPITSEARENGDIYSPYAYILKIYGIDMGGSESTDSLFKPCLPNTGMSKCFIALAESLFDGSRWIVGFDALDWNKSLRIMRGSASALRELHSQSPSLIFRDFKPDNIMLTADFTPVLCDFGTVMPEGVGCDAGTLGYTNPLTIQYGYIFNSVARKSTEQKTSKTIFSHPKASFHNQATIVPTRLVRASAYCHVDPSLDYTLRT
ncbi:hypothetical protein RJ639_013716 [Escallonia herrerae]|uniref:Protein kinase domain-containing protein n=1 Tax=Escallonia herrerae TaxID=1293975 RepID=A0AA88VFE6_9ASTE|nr:hypothetical protein RJ639_013716 [Escallonia herrerae]